MFDLNNDNYYDLKISVETISETRSSAVLKLELIHEPKSAVEPVKVNVTIEPETNKTTAITNKTEEPKAEAEAKRLISITGDAISNAAKTAKENWKTIAVIASYIVLIIIIFLMARKLAGKKGKKAQMPLSSEFNLEDELNQNGMQL
jgi:hypothetical protein